MFVTKKDDTCHYFNPYRNIPLGKQPISFDKVNTKGYESSEGTNKPRGLFLGGRTRPTARWARLLSKSSGLVGWTVW